MRPILAAIFTLFANAAVAQVTPRCAPGDIAPVIGHAAAVDGDTLAAVVNGHRVPNVRLWGVDAPELRNSGKVETTAGMRARVALAELVADKPVTVRPVECDSYGRTVATVEAGGEDLSLAMVRAGMAYVFVHYAFRPEMLDHFNRLQAAEQDAREKRVGLWSVWLPTR